VVIVVDDHRLAHERQVECGQVTNERVQILKGLNPGEMVILEGGFGLPEGTQVQFSDGPEAAKSGAPSR
jgi:hypothetical protein